MIAPCTCGHSRDDHDYGCGTCTNCACERFDEDSNFMECAGGFDAFPAVQILGKAREPAARI
jgi:hypothetical protein